MDFKVAAEQYVERLVEEKRRLAESRLHDFRFSNAKDFSVSELEERMRRCVERAGCVEAVSVKARSGSSANITVKHFSENSVAGLRRVSVTWRRGRNKNVFESEWVIRDILSSEDLLPAIILTDPPKACKLVVGAIQEAVMRKLDAIFRGVGKDEFDSKKVDNAKSAKQARILKFKSMLRDSARGLIKEGTDMEDIRAAVDEVLVAIIHEG